MAGGLPPITLDPNLRRDPFRTFTGMEGLGFEGNPMMNMALQMLAGQIMGNAGMTPFGLRANNLYDRMKSMELQRTHDDLLQRASRRDQSTYYEALRGFSAMTGTPWGAQQIRSAQELSEMMSAAGPVATQMLPGSVLDSLGGYRGLSVVMAENMFQGSRMRIDPMSGRMGLGAEGTQRLNDAVYRSMFEGDGWQHRVGLSAGQMGEVFSEFQRAGMMPGGRVGLDQLDPGLIRRTAQARGIDLAEQPGRSLTQSLQRLPAEDIQALRDDPGVSAAIESFDSQRVVTALRKYQGVTKAMREIFGDAGYTNAPISELINSLNQLTGGAVTQLDPAEANNMVRTTYNLAKSAGVGLEGAMVYAQIANQQAAAFGLERPFGGQILQGALGFRAGFTGAGLGAHPMWGLSGQEELVGADMQRRAAAMQSEMANQMGGALRMEEALGGFKANSDAARYLAAVKQGQTSFKNGAGADVRMVDMSEADFYNMIQSGATTQISDAQLNNILQDRAANQEFVHKHGVGDLVRRQQGFEFADMMARENAERGAIAVGGAATTARARRQLGAHLARVNALGTTALSAEERGSRERRAEILGEQLELELAEIAAGRVQVEGVDRQSAQNMLDKLRNDPAARGLLLENLWGGGETVSRSARNPLGSRSLADTLALGDKAGEQVGLRTTRQAEATALLQQAFAPLSRSGALRRAMQQVMDTEEGDPQALVKAVSAALGGERGDQIAQALSRNLPGEDVNPLQQIRQQSQIFRAAADKFRESGGTENETAMRAAAEGLRDAVRKADAITQRLGLRPDGGQAENIEKLQRTQAIMQHADPDRMAGLVKSEQAQLDDIIASAYDDQSGMSRMGVAGQRNLLNLRQARAELDKLAEAHTGGDLSKLLSAKDLPPEVAKAVEAARADQSAALVALREGIKGGGQNFDFTDPKTFERLSATAAAVGEQPVGKDLLIQSPQDLLRLSDTEIKRVMRQLTPEQAGAVTKAREDYKKLQQQAEEQKQDFFASGGDILRDAYARDRGLSGEDIDDEKLMEWYGGAEEYEKARKALDAKGLVGRARRRKFQQLSEQGQLDDFAKEQGVNFRDSSGFVHGEAAELIKKMPKITGEPGDETAATEPRDTKVTLTAEVMDVRINGDNTAELTASGSGTRN